MVGSTAASAAVPAAAVSLTGLAGTYALTNSLIAPSTVSAMKTFPVPPTATPKG